MLIISRIKNICVYVFRRFSFSNLNRDKNCPENYVMTLRMQCFNAFNGNTSNVKNCIFSFPQVPVSKTQNYKNFFGTGF